MVAAEPPNPAVARISGITSTRRGGLRTRSLYGEGSGSGGSLHGEGQALAIGAWRFITLALRF